SEAILSVYGGGALLFLTLWGAQALLDSLPVPWKALGDALAKCLEPLQPYYLIELAWADEGAGSLGARLLTAALSWGGPGALCLALAGGRRGPGLGGQLERAGVARGRGGDAARPPVGDAPVLWRERYVEGVAPLPPLRRLPRRLGLLLIGVATVLVLALL